MGIEQIIQPEWILLTGDLKTKEEVLASLAELLVKADIVSGKDIFLESIFEREGRSSSYVGSFLAIPHGWSEAVVEPAIAIAKTEIPIDWDGCGHPVKLIFLLAIPENADLYPEAETMQHVICSLADNRLLERLLEAASKIEITDILYSLKRERENGN